MYDSFIIKIIKERVVNMLTLNTRQEKRTKKKYSKTNRRKK